MKVLNYNQSQRQGRKLSRRKPMKITNNKAKQDIAKHTPKTLNDVRTLIHTIRGQRVMLDADLAALYGVETRTLKQAVNRNIERFPEDFLFELSAEELEN